MCLIPKHTVFPLHPTAGRICTAPQSRAPAPCTPSSSRADRRAGALGKDALNTRHLGRSSAPELPLDLGQDAGACGTSVSSLCPEMVLTALSSSVILRACLQIACGGQSILLLPVWLLGGRRQQESKVNQFQPRLKPKR